MRRTCTVASTPKSFAGCCQRAALTLRLRRCRRERCRHTRECFERGGTRRHAAARGGTRRHAVARGGTRRHAVARGGTRWHAAARGGTRCPPPWASTGAMCRTRIALSSCTLTSGCLARPHATRRPAVLRRRTRSSVSSIASTPPSTARPCCQGWQARSRWRVRRACVVLP